MSKAYKESDFSSQLDSDRSWRLKEISDLKALTARADERAKAVLMRSLVAICYAHWEGHVKFCATKYFEHITLKRLQLRLLDPQFRKNHFLPRLVAFFQRRASVSDACEFLEEVLESDEKRFVRINDNLISTRSNLRSDVMEDICTVCGVDFSFFREKATFIDKLLCDRRNEIAHGENTMINLEDLDVLTNQTVDIMRHFGNILENKIYLQEYRAA